MFETLTDKLQRAFKNLRGQGKLTEEHLDAGLVEIREALLEGDVNVGVADEFVKHVREKALGSEVLLQLSPDQQVVKLSLIHIFSSTNGFARSWDWTIREILGCDPLALSLIHI